MSEDEELAEIALRQSTERRPPKVRVSEWSPEFEMLVNIFDRLGDVIKAAISANGGKAPKINPHPRPRTAADRLRERFREEKHRKTVSRVLIRKEDGTLQPIPSPTTAKTPARPVLPGEDPFRMRTR